MSATELLREAVEGRQWYHTLELAPGIVTPGWFDTRAVADKLPLPPSTAGMRCLDVGTFDGFWAFELERRGAEEVVAVDVLDPYQWDWPAGAAQATVEALAARKRAGDGFEVAHAALESHVRRRPLSVYELDPDELGSFDFVYLGSLLLHLRDPVGALQRVRSVCRGRLLLVDQIDLPLTLRSRRPVARLDAVGRPWWWRPNLAALVRMVQAAGFTLEAPPQRLFMPAGAGHPQLSLRGAPRALRNLRHAEGREVLWASLVGAPHAALLCRPGEQPVSAPAA